MFGRISSFLPGAFRQTQVVAEDEEDGYESASSAGSFDSCQSDVEQYQDSPLVQKKEVKKEEFSPAAQSSVHPLLFPLVEPKRESCDAQKKEPKEEELTTAVASSVYPPLSSIATQAATPAVALSSNGECRNSAAMEGAEISTPSCDGMGSCFVDPDPIDTFTHHSTLVQPLGAKKVSNPARGQIMYKNELQTFCQRSKTKLLPEYFHEMDGPGHAPRFRAAVKVDGRFFSSEGFHGSKVDAEQNAAEVALANLCPGAILLHQPGIKNIANPLQRQHQQMSNSAFSELTNNSYGGRGPLSESIGSYSRISAQPVPSQELPSVAEAPITPLFSCSVTGASSVTTDNARKKRRAVDGLTIDTPIDLTEDEQSVGSNPPVASSSSPAASIARSQAAASAHGQYWGPFSTESASFSGNSKGAVDAKNPFSSNDAPPAPAPAPAEVVAGKLAGLHINRKPFSESKKPSSKQQTRRWPPQTQHLTALGKLNFVTHAFPLLTRLNGLPLEEAYSLEDIAGLEEIPADGVHSYLFEVERYTRPENRLPLSWAQTDPTLLLYDCHIDPEGAPEFRATENRQGSSLLQRTLGFDRILRVFFNGTFSQDRYKDFLKDGIFIGLRHYQYFVYKPADRLDDEEEKKDSEGVKCYFVCTDSRASSDRDLRKFNTVADARTLFMHVHNCATVPKYIARLQLCLTKTLTITGISFPDVSITEMEDVLSKYEANPTPVFTDGTGFISPDLAKLMPLSIFKGMSAEESEANDLYEAYPTLVQVRFFHDGCAFKGTLLANKEIPLKSIKFYTSMKKVERDPALAGESISSFDLVSASRRPRRARLSQDLIVLLSIGGVGASVFVDAVKQAAKDVLMVLEDRKMAIREVCEWDWDSDVLETILAMLTAGIPLKELYLQKYLLLLIKNKMTHFARGKVPLEGTYYLMGTADPSGTLEPDQVAIYLSDGGTVCGPVIVFRHPGKHPGDPHKVEAVHSQALQKIIGVGKSVIFFSTKGCRPIPHEIAFGDYDGDMYWICQNKKVVDRFNEWPTRWSPEKINFEEEESPDTPERLLCAGKLEDALIKEYLNERFNKSFVVGIASNQWLKHMDGYLNPTTSSADKKLHLTEALKYPDYIYEAVDTKSRKKLRLPVPPRSLKDYNPPYLSKKYPKPDPSQKGKSVLGMIYDVGSSAQGNVTGPRYGREDCRPDPAFHVEESKQHMAHWKQTYNVYRIDMGQACDEKGTNPDGPNQVNLKYKMKLYGGPSFRERTKPMETVLAEASAIYQVVYTKAAETVHQDKDPKVSFAWNVAGAALAFLYAGKQPGGNALVFAPGLYKQLHKRSKTRAPNVPSSARV